MLLLIDPEKVKKQLAENPLVFTTTSSYLETQPELPYKPEPIHISGTEMVVPPEIERERARLQSLRQSLKPLSPDELDRKINEIRGRD